MLMMLRITVTDRFEIEPKLLYFEFSVVVCPLSDLDANA